MTRKVNPLEHLKKPTRISHPEKSRDQKLAERKDKGKKLATALVRGKKK